jgi:cysteinyl-tRNA synthetase
MTLQLYNTLTREKEAFATIEPGVVRMYVCGVTVYDSAHVGHAMSSLVFDTLRRYLEHRGYRVRYVQNFTDVDDKIIAKANREGTSAFEVADRYAREFLGEQERLGILPATLNPRVSSDMPVIIAMIQTLVAGEHAYAADNGDVYFDVSSYPGYGRLSRRPQDEAMNQGEPTDFKDDPLDFALWKAAKPGEPAWDSPWGPGRPGWHIECSAMAQRHLGDQIDIHGGGMDLVFPHHENEIAQSECATGHAPFARYWLHNGMLQLSGEKMSKSLGNVVGIRAFLDEHEPDALRLFVLSSHYRAPATLSDESISAAEKGLDRLRGALRPAQPRPAADPGAGGELAAATERADSEFHAAMDDDFGTPGALAALFGLVTAINRARDAGADERTLSLAQAVLVERAGVLGFNLAAERGDRASDLAAAPFIELLIALRNEARAAKDWARADQVRVGLAELGVVLEDGPGGTRWVRG